MNGYAEVSVKNAVGETIGTFRVDLPEKPIADGNPESHGTRFVVDERTGGTYGIGLGAIYVGMAASRPVTACEADVRDAPSESESEPKFNVGDRVKVTGENDPDSVAGDHSIDIGETVTIKGGRDLDGDYWVDAGYRQSYVHESNLRGIQVGDAVRITGNYHAPRQFLQIGTLATVEEVYARDFKVRGVSARNGEMIDQIVSDQDCELA